MDEEARKRYETYLATSIAYHQKMSNHYQKMSRLSFILMLVCSGLAAIALLVLVLGFLTKIL